MYTYNRYMNNHLVNIGIKYDMMYTELFHIQLLTFDKRNMEF